MSSPTFDGVEEVDVASRAFVFYRTYLALKLHFDRTKKYDYRESDGRITASIDSFHKRKDWKAFAWMAQRINPQLALDYFLAQVRKDGKLPYPMGLRRNETIKDLEDFAHIKRNAPRKFTLELGNLVPSGSMSDLKSYIITKEKGGGFPLQLLVLTRELSLETTVLLDDVTKFIDFYDKHGNVPGWEDRAYLIRAYGALLGVDRREARQSLRETFARA